MVSGAGFCGLWGRFYPEPATKPYNCPFEQLAGTWARTRPTDLVEVDYEPPPAVVDVEAALAARAVVHLELGDNVFSKGEFATAGFDQAFASGDVVLRERFQSTRVAGAPPEPRGCVAVVEPGRGTLTFWSSTQIPPMLRTALADLVDVPGLTEAKIRVVTPTFPP